MGRHLILRGVDRRLIQRIRERAAPLGLGAGELVRAMLMEQLAGPSTHTPRARPKRRRPSKA
jgi:hypothetical protein